MKNQIKIGIVEDELLIAEKIKRTLLEIGYDVCEPVSTYEEALDMIESEAPDLVLLDVNLQNKKDGINIGQYINETHPIPIIFLTAYSDAATVERAKKVRPYAYLVKPYTKEELFAAVEIAFNNFKAFTEISDKTKSVPQRTSYTFIKEQNRFIKILLETILYIESMENYVVIYSNNHKKSTIRSTFSEFLEQLPKDKFYRTHRSFAIHTDFIDNIEYSEVIVAGQKVPMSKTYRQGLFNLLGIK